MTSLASRLRQSPHTCDNYIKNKTTPYRIRFETAPNATCFIIIENNLKSLPPIINQLKIKWAAINIYRHLHYIIILINKQIRRVRLRRLRAQGHLSVPHTLSLPSHYSNIINYKLSNGAMYMATLPTQVKIRLPSWSRPIVIFVSQDPLVLENSRQRRRRKDTHIHIVHIHYSNQNVIMQIGQLMFLSTWNLTLRYNQ